MVGIPGRSKGCVTCRKRKKGCDLKRPECGQCKERGTTCGGYDSDRIFIYQSAEYNKCGVSTSTIRRSQDTVSSIPLGSSPRPLPQMQIVPYIPLSDTAETPRRSQPVSISVVLPESLTRSAYSEKSMEAFLQMYIPSGDFRSTNIEGKYFVSMLPMLSIRDKALQMAVLAIGTTALGKTTGDEDLTRRGRSLYGKALKETAVALRNPTRAKSEAVFAIPRVMCLFEMLFGAEAMSGKQAKSWLSHAEGETALILARSPEAYSENEEAHLLFVNARIRPLIAAVRARKASQFNEERWKTLPWRGRVKTPNDALIDILCGVPELLESNDILNSTDASEKGREALRVNIVAKCWTLHFQLEAWLAAYPDEAYTPTTTDSATPISFTNLELGCLTIRYWVTALILYSALDTASGVPPGSTSTSHPDRPHPRHFARLIARSVSFFFQEQHGITGATAISFPLGNALFWIVNNNPAVDREYLGMVAKTLNDPMLPSAIRDFLGSMRQSVPWEPPAAIPSSGVEEVA